MATHELSLSVPSGEIHNGDVIVTVHSDGVKLGELRVSRGSIDWKPRKLSNRGCCAAALLAVQPAVVGRAAIGG